MRNRLLSLIFSALLLSGTVGVAGDSWADDDPQALVEAAKETVVSFRNDKGFPAVDERLANAHGVIIAPELVKAGFIIGGETGNVVVLARNPVTGEWSQPAFYTLSSGSIGLQAGVELSEVLAFVRTEEGMDKLISDSIKFGADVGVAVVTVGAGVEGGSTTNLDADIVALARGKGLFGGISLEGSILSANEELNESYYGRSIESRGVLRHKMVANPKADKLRAVLDVRAKQARATIH